MSSEQDKLDNLYKNIDELLLKGLFKECDDYISNIDVKKISIPEMLIILSATMDAKPTLIGRNKFFNKAKAELNARNSDVSLLEGFV